MDIQYRKLGVNGFDVVKYLVEKNPSVKPVFLSGHAIGYIGYEALYHYKIPGYIIKGATYQEIHRALIKIARGDIYYSQEVYEVIREYTIKKSETLTLTERQKEVLVLVVDEYIASEIGEMLCISTDTVREHINNLRAKLGVRSNTGLGREAVLRELIDLSKYRLD